MELSKDYTGFTGTPRDILNTIGEGKYIVATVEHGHLGLIITKSGGLSFSLSHGEESILEDYDWCVVPWSNWTYNTEIVKIIDYFSTEKLIFER